MKRVSGRSRPMALPWPRTALISASMMRLNRSSGAGWVVDTRVKEHGWGWVRKKNVIFLQFFVRTGWRAGFVGKFYRRVRFAR